MRAGKVLRLGIGLFIAGIVAGLALADRHRSEREFTSSPLTAVELEERAEKLAERREKLDYFYITAFTAILVFTFNDLNAKDGLLQRAPLWLVELGWGALIGAALCPLYVIGARFKRFAMNLDEIAGKPVDKGRFKALRGRGDLVHIAMTLLFLIGVVSLAVSYGLGLSSAHV
jgi:hypothetical protein